MSSDSSGRSPREGWKWVWGSTRQHWFREGRSLCRRWLTLTMRDADPAHTWPGTPVCKRCMQKLEKEKHKGGKHE